MIHSNQDVLFSVVGKAATVEQRRLPESGDLQPQSLDIWRSPAQRAWRNTAHQVCLPSEPHCILSGSGRELNLPDIVQVKGHLDLNGQKRRPDPSR